MVCLLLSITSTLGKRLALSENYLAACRYLLKRRKGMKKIVTTVICAVGVLLLSAQVYALDFDFSGTFGKDNDIVQLNFSVGAASTVTIFSSSWGDPSDPVNGYKLRGGFDPILAIWNSIGDKVAEQDDGGNVGSTFSNGVSYFHGYWDSYFDVALAAGNYVATIGQYNNFAAGTNLSAGFLYDNNPTFTQTQAFGPNTYFNGVWGGISAVDDRTGDWAFHILNVESASNSAIPEPATMLLLGMGLVGLAGFSRRLSKQS
jgi:hypothetical protein